jgi:hypothetical protein
MLSGTQRERDMFQKYSMRSKGQAYFFTMRLLIMLLLSSTSGSRGRKDNHGLHSCAQPQASRRSQPGGRALR